MKRALVLALAAASLAIAGYLAMRSTTQIAPAAVEEEPVVEVPKVAPIEGSPCRIDGSIQEGIAARVRVHSRRARIDVDARLLRDGRAYSAELPEQGDLQVVAVANDGRTSTRRVVCGGDGRVQLDLQFPPTDPLAATLAGRCIYLETGAPVPEAAVGSDVWSGLTDEEGRFVLSVPPGTFSVRCRKDGDESEELAVRLPPKGKKEVQLFVEARAAIAGIVVRAGAPVEGVHVSARSPSEEERERAVSDAEGRFVIRDLRPGAVVVEAHHRGAFAEAQAVAKIELPYAEVKLELREGSLGIAGTIRGDDGPLPGASIEVIASGRRSDRAPLRRGTVADAEGRFEVGGLVGGEYTVIGRADGYVPNELDVEVDRGAKTVELVLARACITRFRVLPAEPRRAVEVSIYPKEGESAVLAGETGQTLELTGSGERASIAARTIGSSVRTASISAQLCGPEIAISLPKDQGSGAIEAFVHNAEHAPVSGVRVWLEERGVAETGADGKAKFEALTAGEYWLGARDVEPTRVEVQAGLTSYAELEVSRDKGVIEGTVVAEHAAVEGARVLASCRDSGWDRREAGTVVARSGAGGAFSFEPKDGSVCTVRAEHDSLGRSAQVTLRVGGPPAEIALLAPGSISGRVTEVESGAAVDRFSVTARAIGRSSELEARTVYVSDPSGRYRIDDVGPGHVSVSVTAERGNAHREVELAPGEDKRSVDFVVFGQGVVKGRVLSAEPLFGANVMVRAQGRARGRMTTEADGRFAIEIPAGEPLRVFVRADGYYPWGSLPFDLSADGPTDLGDIVLKPRGGDEEKEGGLGIMFSGDGRGIRVIRFTDDSPAREAGMEPGDLITAIDGVPAGREPLVNWVVNLRGLAGTPVVLEIERGTMPPFTVTVIRRAIGLDPVP